jgi:DnaJ family protein B protein 11
LEDALTGFSTTIKHLDGHIVTVKRDGITWHGFKMRVNKEGMPNLTDNTKFGSLIVTVDVAFPKKELTREQKELIRNMLQQDDVSPDFYNGIKFPRKKS